jgi:hypothetical protein
MMPPKATTNQLHEQSIAGRPASSVPTGKFSLREGTVLHLNTLDFKPTITPH